MCTGSPNHNHESQTAPAQAPASRPQTGNRRPPSPEARVKGGQIASARNQRGPGGKFVARQTVAA